VSAPWWRGAFCAIAVVVPFACSSFEATTSSSPDAGSTDATTPSDGGGGDGSSPARLCDRNAAFTIVRRVDGLNTPSDEGYLRLSADELVVWFQRGNLADAQILRAQRSSRDKPCDGIAPGPGIPVGSVHVAPARDELSVLYVRFNADGRERYDIFLAKRASTTAPFDQGTRLPLASSNHWTWPFLAPYDETELYAGTTQPPSAAYDIVRMHLEDGSVTAPVAIGTVNTLTDDNNAVLSHDGLTMYFYSEDKRPTAKGAIWVSHRDAKTDPFRTPSQVLELVPEASTAYSAPSWISPDLCRLYFISDIDRATKGVDIFVAERTP
jgi:hypothetical protein